MPEPTQFIGEKLSKVNKIFFFYDNSTFSTTARETFSQFNAQAPFKNERLVQYCNIEEDSEDVVFSKIKILQKEELFEEGEETIDKFWCVFFVADDSMSQVHKLCKSLQQRSTSIFKEFIFFSNAKRIEYISKTREYKGSKHSALINDLSDVTPLAFHFILAEEGENSSYSESQLGSACSFYLHLLRLNFCSNPNLCFCGDFLISSDQPNTLGCQVYEAKDDIHYEAESSFILDSLLLDLWNSDTTQNGDQNVENYLVTPEEIMSYLLPKDVFTTIKEPKDSSFLQLIFDAKNIFSVSLNGESKQGSKPSINYSGNFVEQIISLDEYKNFMTYFVKEYLTTRTNNKISLIKDKLDKVILDNLTVSNDPQAFLKNCRTQINSIINNLQKITSLSINGLKGEHDYRASRQAFIDSSQSLVNIYNVSVRVLLVTFVFLSFLIYPIALRLFDRSIVFATPYLPMTIWIPLVSLLSIYLFIVYFWASHKIKYGQVQVDGHFDSAVNIVQRMCLGDLLSSSVQELNVTVNVIQNKYLTIVDEIVEEKVMSFKHEELIANIKQKKEHISKHIDEYHKNIIAEIGGTSLHKIEMMTNDKFLLNETKANISLLSEISNSYLDSPWWNKTVNIKTFTKAVKRNPIHGQTAKTGGRIYSIGNKSLAKQLQSENTCAPQTRTDGSPSAIIGVSLIQLTKLR